MSKQIINRINEINYNKNGTEMKIIQYNNYDDIIVEFQDEFKIKVHTNYYHFSKGNVFNPYDKSFYKIAFIGSGNYSYKTHKKAYEIWKHMLQRCYDPYFINKHLSYKDCFVCDEWHNFQNFAKWYEENYYEIPNEKMCLDKDILYKGNKIYSPKTCIITPNNINVLFIKSDKSRGNYPIGVSWRKDRGKFTSRCHNEYGEYESLGCYDTIEDAFYSYKVFKEKVIKQVANKYKDLIPQMLYVAMYNYEVEIND